MPNAFETHPALHEQLVANVLLGDEGAARTLVSLLGPIIRRVAARHDFAMREDLIQEVWAHLWANNCRVLQQWDRRGPFVHFVGVVALNLMRDRDRRPVL